MSQEPGPAAEETAAASVTEHGGPEPEDLGLDRAMLDNAIGGWRGMIDSGVPAAVFVVAYMVTSQQLRPSLIAALAAGGVIALVRIVRREPMQQVAAGFFGVAISALVATRTGRAENFFLVGILINVGYMLAYAVSCLVRWPLLGLIVGYVRGDATGWREDPRLYRAYATASWVWVAMFGVRLAIQLPLYFAGAVGLLGAAKLALGWPLFLLAAYLSYQIIHPVLRQVQEQGAALQAAPGVEPESA